MNETDINKEILSRLDLLANKLGVAADELWNMLIYQSILQGWTQIIGSVVVLIVLITGSKLWFNNIKEYPSDTEYRIAFTIVNIIAYLFYFSIVFSNIPGSIGHITNPGYFAFQDIIRHIK